MECILKIDVPTCQMAGPVGSAVTLKIVPAADAGPGTVTQFVAADYDGTDLTPAGDELTFTIKAGRKNLSVSYFVTGHAELHEKCDGNTLIDDEITPANQLKPYFVCGAPAGGGGQ